MFFLLIVVVVAVIVLAAVRRIDVGMALLILLAALTLWVLAGQPGARF